MFGSILNPIARVLDATATYATSWLPSPAAMENDKTKELLESDAQLYVAAQQSAQLKATAQANAQALGIDLDVLVRKARMQLRGEEA